MQYNLKSMVIFSVSRWSEHISKMKTEYDVWYRDMRDFTNVALYEKFSTK